jgi:hypothetical protein
MQLVRSAQSTISRLILAGVIGSAAAAAGCSAPRRSLGVSTLTVDAELPIELDLLFDSARETLRRSRFTLDRVDRRDRIVTTLPVTSQSMFEPWRHDVDTARDLWESTLNPIRRWAEVHLRSESDGAAVTLDVIVHKERLSSPDRQFNSSGAAYQFFGDRLPSTEGLTNVAPEHDRWMDIGRDPAMESYLLTEILEGAGMTDRVKIAPNPERM